MARRPCLGGKARADRGPARAATCSRGRGTDQGQPSGEEMEMSGEPVTETIRLRDGRLLEFAEYGDPGGVPALFFHGFIGSHHQARFAHPAAARHGVRLLAVNRPGVGRSTYRRRSSLAESATDV